MFFFGPQPTTQIHFHSTKLSPCHFVEISKPKKDNYIFFEIIAIPLLKKPLLNYNIHFDYFDNFGNYQNVQNQNLENQNLENQNLENQNQY